MSLDKHIQSLLTENNRRQQAIHAKFNPITGEGSPCPRTRVEIADFPLPTQFLPNTMLAIPLVAKIIKAGSLKAFFGKQFPTLTYSDAERAKIIDQFRRVRIKHDFPFWAATLAYIKQKGGGDDILFRLNRAQRRLVERLEKMRLAGKPIRLILLKARQWGGSTCIQLYMAWLQLVHCTGLNSLIVAHQGTATDEIHDMFSRMIERYPLELLYPIGEIYNKSESKYVGVGKSGNIHRVPQRNCKIKLGTAERPKSARGGDYNLIHLSEVGIWVTTDNKTPEQIVASAQAGVLLEPYTLIVYESTANGTGNFFHHEYLDAKAGTSQFEALFIPWLQIDKYSLPFATEQEKEEFATWLYENRNKAEVNSTREEPGIYLWRLWNLGATLEAIHWYIEERKKYTSHASMASEFPSDDIEAFTFSGHKVFDDTDIEQFRPACKPPKFVGEIYGKESEGEGALQDLILRQEKNGRLSVWQDVERDSDTEYISDRYLVVVDVCKGHTKRADYAVIVVFDRLYMVNGEPPAVVAQWYGHIPMDQLAWKAAQIAQYYNEAKLVIESNTLETNNTKGEAEYILTLIRDVYPNLYARKQTAEDIKEKRPRKYGFHTNTLTKKVIIENLQKVLRQHLYTERDEGCLDEYSTYIETEDGKYEAQNGYHDDRLMTRAIGLQISTFEMPVPRIVTVSKTTFSPRIISEATI